MSVEEIKKAIYELSSEERKKLINAFVPRAVQPTPEKREQIESIIKKNDSENSWVDWTDLKAEMEH